MTMGELLGGLAIGWAIVVIVVGGYLLVKGHRK